MPLTVPIVPQRAAWLPVAAFLLMGVLRPTTIGGCGATLPNQECNVGSHNFHSLAEVRNTLELFKATTEQEKETLVAMGVLTVLVDAILKVVAEVEELKSHQEQPRRK